MKAKFVLSIMVLFVFLGCKITPGVLTEKDIERTWKVVLLKFTTSNTEKYFVTSNCNNSEIKIWSKGYFVFAGVHNNFTSSGGGTTNLTEIVMKKPTNTILRPAWLTKHTK